MNPNAFPGHELRERREALGLTVDDVFRKIRIPSHYLNALEDADFRVLPAASYTVGFLKTYCEFLELDAPRFMDSFRACVRPSAGRFLGIRRDKAKALPQWVGEAVTWCGICAVLALVWFTYSLVFQPQGDFGQGRVQAGTLELKLPSDTASNGE
ncbi:MAG: helix-turn-helix domain-containing protein [Candidatus Hydrogenedentes bacterium]|nr:helix-turn-helix domain-containing protein [Candidatus Hydrogenedentota bacterium]